MEIFVKYIAKDGSVFEDPLQCEDYEKNDMGVIGGSIASLIRDLKKLPQNYYCSCIFYIKGEHNTHIYTGMTRSIEPYLGSYVNVADVEESNRYLSCTVGNVVNDFCQYDQNSPVCGMMVCSNDIDMKKVNVIQWTNSKCWENARQL